MKKNNLSVLDIYVDPKQHCITRKWYCKFIPWFKHGEWKILGKIVSIKELQAGGK